MNLFSLPCIQVVHWGLSLGGRLQSLNLYLKEEVMRIRIGKAMAIAILAVVVGRIAYGVCCSSVALIPHGSSHQLMRYVVVDKWAHCTTGGPIRTWIAQNAFIAHAWIQRAESSGHCVNY